MRMASFGTMVSGLRAAQTGLSVTGHNMANVETVGFTRQRALQVDAPYNSVGMDGKSRMKLGLGTDVKEIRQIRDGFLDAKYRTESSIQSFYQTKASTLEQIETILGELYNDGRMSESLTNMWKSLQELVSHPEGYETRAMFVSSADKFISRANDVFNGMYEYQLNLNEQVISTVDRINEIAVQIEDLNQIIMKAESAGDFANDYRDMRNLLVDELASYAEIEVKEDSRGRLNVSIEGNDLVANGSISKIGLRQCSNGYPFVEPVFTNSKDVLPPGSTAPPLFRNLGTKPVNAENENDKGSLKALLLTRGPAPGNYDSSDASVQNYTIPKAQHEFDTLINSLVNLFNDLVAPKRVNGSGGLEFDDLNAPYHLNDTDSKRGYEIFSRRKVDRFDSSGNYNGENSADWNTLYTSGNLVVNPKILNDPNLLAFSRSATDKGDTKLLSDFLSNWKSSGGNNSPSFTANGVTYNFDDFYKEMVVDIGQQGQEARTTVSAQNGTLTKIMNDKSSMSGVSLDEEMSNMLKYQHAYNAAARMVNILDSMLDTIINRM